MVSRFAESVSDYSIQASYSALASQFSNWKNVGDKVD